MNLNADELRHLLERPAITVEDAMGVLGLCRGTAYKAAKAGELPNFRIGRKIMVPTAPLKRMLGLEPEEA